MSARWAYSLDADPPTDPSVARAYWCDMDYFLAHTATGDHPPCRCPEGQGHNDPSAPTQAHSAHQEDTHAQVPPEAQ